jgi:hypothetical protein
MTTLCAYCHHALGDQRVERCPTCHTPHHAECWRENEGCAVAMCESAPKLPYIPQQPPSGPAGTRERVSLSLGDDGSVVATQRAEAAERTRARRRRRTIRAVLIGLLLVLLVAGLLTFLLVSSSGDGESPETTETVTVGRVVDPAASGGAQP